MLSSASITAISPIVTRSLPIPVIGRIQDDAFILDLRCLEDEEGFLSQLSNLKI